MLWYVHIYVHCNVFNNLSKDGKPQRAHSPGAGRANTPLMGYTQASLGRLHLDTDPFDSPLPSQRSTLNRRDSHILAEISEMETTFTSQEQVSDHQRQNMVLEGLDDIIDLFDDIHSHTTISNESLESSCNKNERMETLVEERNMNLRLDGVLSYRREFN